MNEKHANIPIFIPHAGCRQNCVFCDQKSITGADMPDPEEIRARVENALETLGGRRAEIAFFGGSFTAIDRGLMVRCLEAVKPFLSLKEILGIRLSTRPDCIDRDVVLLLKDYGCATIEIGVQSMDDETLRLSGRGHTAKDSERAIGLIKEIGGIAVIGQMMLGLPGSSAEKDLLTARAICRCGVDGARIYPTAVLKNTALHKMTLEGLYTPLTLGEGVARGTRCLDEFVKNSVPVLRMGLCAEESCDAAVVAGCYHPAYGEMVRSRLYGERLDAAFERARVKRGEKITVVTAPGEQSAAAGYRRENRNRLSEKYGCVLNYAAFDKLRAYEVQVRRG